MDEGWIKLNRKIIKHWIFEDAEYFRAWVWLLIVANHEDGKVLLKGNLVIVKRGQKLTSIRKMSQELGWGVKRTMKFLELLESDGMIARENLKQATLISIDKYQEYQGFGCHYGNADNNAGDNENDTQTINKRNKEIKEQYVDVGYLDNIESEQPEPSSDNLYGIYKNVFLLPEQYEDIRKSWPTIAIGEVNKLSAYIKRTNRSYGSHYSVLVNWCMEDFNKAQEPRNEPAAKSFSDKMDELVQRITEEEENGRKVIDATGS